jgi:hypothetical protein
VTKHIWLLSLGLGLGRDRVADEWA